MRRLPTLIASEAGTGILLALAAVAAVLAANLGPLVPLYDTLLKTPVQVSVGALIVAKPLLLWINDGLMAIFFLYVGAEIKREMLIGVLADRRVATLPSVAAIGGVAIPALIYVAIAFDDPVAVRGWAIPAATDIAFAVGVVVLLGRYVPTSLKVFLLALAIIDDIAAIVIIAAFYTADLAPTALAVAAGAIVVLAALNRLSVASTAPYMVVGLVLWVSVLKSGVHATLAGIVLGLMLPIEARGQRPLERVEHGLDPWVKYAILPAFAFANAGVDLTNLSADRMFAAIPLGIALGLFLGKQLGVFAFAWLAVRVGLARLPEGVGWPAVYGVGILTGIGFTMSLFIGGLAFDDPGVLDGVRLGVLAGSIASALWGWFWLASIAPRLDARIAARASAGPADPREAEVTPP